MVFMNDVLYGRALAMLDYGTSVGDIAKNLCVSHRTIRYWRLKGCPPSQSKTKRLPRKATPLMAKRRKYVHQLITKEVVREAVAFTPKLRKKKIRSVVLRPYNSPSRVARALCVLHKVVASPATVRRDLLQLGLSAKRIRSGPGLTDLHKQYRVSFARAMLAANLDIMFSDETQLDTNHGQSAFQWVENGVEPEVRVMDQGPASLTLWGCIAIGFKLLIVLPRETLTMESYQELILKPSIEAIRQYQQKRAAEGFTTVFQQDNARPHCRSEKYLRRRHVKTLPQQWPAVSCDLSPIEQCWQWLDSRVKRRGPYGVDELRKFAIEEFAAIPQDAIDRLVESFPGRCRKVIFSRGSVIKP